MSRVIFFVTFVILLKINHIVGSLVPDFSIRDAFYAQFTQLLQSLQNGTIVDDVTDTEADLLRYNLGLTNEDKELNVTQLLSKYGYSAEQYVVQTPDGYELTLVRIPRSGQPVLVVHGILCSADEFVTSGPDQALAYALADENYDVWLGNTRGNKYSRKNIYYTPDQEQFWNFTFHDIGINDLSTFIDFILEKSNVSQLYYIGHSAGTTASYVLLSQRPQYNEKIALLTSLAPVAWMNHIKSPVAKALVPLKDQIYLLTESFGIYELFSNRQFIKAVKEVVCGTSVSAVLVCSTVVSPLFGFDVAQVNFTDYPVQMIHVPAGGTSTKEILHFSQEVPRSEQFQLFDYGAEKNLVVYGSIRPPPYDVSKITAKTVLFYSDNDYLSSEEDVQTLASKLPNLVKYYKVPFPFNHVDYLWAKDAKEMVYTKIIELLREHQS